MSRAEKALELREKGYNCCQCTVCAFAEELDADYKTVFKCAEALGAGMGGMEGLCGAVSGFQGIFLSDVERATGRVCKEKRLGRMQRSERYGNGQGASFLS